jgi:hypothetical protein
MTEPIHIPYSNIATAALWLDAGIGSAAVGRAGGLARRDFCRACTGDGHCRGVSSDGFEQFGRTRVFDEIAGRTSVQAALGDRGIIVHAHHNDTDARVVSSDAADERQTSKSVASKSEIQDDDIGSALPVVHVSAEEIAGTYDRLDPGIFKNAPASLDDKRMVVDD